MAPITKYRKCVVCGKRWFRLNGDKRKFMAKFPLDEDRCRQWVKNIGNEDLAYIPIEKLHDSKYVCGDHFQSNDFNKKKSRLKKWAVPSILMNMPSLSDHLLPEFPCHIAKTPTSSSAVTISTLVLDATRHDHNYLHFQDRSQHCLGFKNGLKKHAVPSYFPWNPPPPTQEKIFVSQEPTSWKTESDKENSDPLDYCTDDDNRPSTVVQSSPSENGSGTSDVEYDMVLPFNAPNSQKKYANPNNAFYFTQEMPYIMPGIITGDTTQDPLFLDEFNEADYADSDMDVSHNVEICSLELKLFETDCTGDVIVKEENIEEPDITPVIDCIACGHIPSYSVHSYKNDSKVLHFYTGLENFDKLMFVFYSLGNDVNNLNYFYSRPPSHLDALEQFCMVLLILRRRREYEDMAITYKTTVKQIMNIFITWIRFMAIQWRTIDLWLSRDAVTHYLPLDFYDKYPNTRVIIDATECPIRKPHLPSAQQVTFSTYKNRNTIKFLVGMAPSGLITYISPCYGGSASDRQIVERSSLLNRFDYNDEIMVDKGLNVQDIFLSYGVKVNIPTFFKKGNQINPNTLTRDRNIARKRVHVERIIGMLKTYKILIKPMNHTETLLSSDITFVIAMLVNFRSNIMNKKSL